MSRPGREGLPTIGEDKWGIDEVAHSKRIFEDLGGEDMNLDAAMLAAALNNNARLTRIEAMLSAIYDKLTTEEDDGSESSP